MKQNLILIVLLLLLFTNVNSQEFGENFKSFEINKQVHEYSNQFDLSTPLNSFVTFKYLKSEGKQCLYKSVNSYRIKGFFPSHNTLDSKLSKEKKEALLNTKIKQIITYKDSIAGVITDYSEPLCIITYLSLEDGEWLNAGEGLGNDLSDACEKFRKNASVFLGFIHKINELKTVSTDTTSFLNYLRNKGKVPEEFVLNALSNHKIVIYGELHRRKTSWDLLKRISRNPRFVKNVGTIFLELSSDKQNELNMFFSNEKLDKEIILDIFRNVQLNGWYDKGMYEFLIDLWILNKNLPKNARINVVAVDEPRPFVKFNNKEELEAHFNNILDRNEQMAKIISETIKTQKETRNNLFIVGAAHAYKSSVPGIGAGRPKSESKPTVAAQLVEIFSNEEVFTIFSHCPIISNNGTIHGRIRNGLFDDVFAKLGNRSIAFKLTESPFGIEPFDAIYEISYETLTGSFENNYDAYLFLESLETEPHEYLFYDIITDEYVEELKRRANLTDSKVEKWFDVEEVTKEDIISKLKNKYENKKRWSGL